MNLLSNYLNILPQILLLGYLGPETIMPLASIVATIIGTIFIFWRFIWGSLKKIFKIGQPLDDQTLVESDSTTDEDELKDEVHYQ
jgi:hypothetical protein